MAIPEVIWKGQKKIWMTGADQTTVGQVTYLVPQLGFSVVRELTMFSGYPCSNLDMPKENLNDGG